MSRAVSRETGIGIGVGALAVAAMAVDHLLEDEGDFPADPPGFLVFSGLSLTLAEVVFGRFVPRAKAGGAAAERAATRGIVCSLLGLLPTYFAGLPFVLGGGGIALGLLGRRGARRRLAAAAVVIGAIVVLLGVAIYVDEAVRKLS